jgi:hypothetical protein
MRVRVHACSDNGLVLIGQCDEALGFRIACCMMPSVNSAWFELRRGGTTKRGIGTARRIASLANRCSTCTRAERLPLAPTGIAQHATCDNGRTCGKATGGTRRSGPATDATAVLPVVWICYQSTPPAAAVVVSAQPMQAAAACCMSLRSARSVLADGSGGCSGAAHINQLGLDDQRGQHSRRKQLNLKGIASPRHRHR